MIYVCLTCWNETGVELKQCEVCNASVEYDSIIKINQETLADNSAYQLIRLMNCTFKGHGLKIEIRENMRYPIEVKVHKEIAPRLQSAIPQWADSVQVDTTAYPLSQKTIDDMELSTRSQRVITEVISYNMDSPLTETSTVLETSLLKV